MTLPIKATLYAVLALVILTVNSCCRSAKCKCQAEWNVSTDDCTPRHYGPYPLGAAYDYLYFKPGSWWVYQNSLTNEYDTISVITCDTAVLDRVGKDLRYNSITYTTLYATHYSSTFKTYYRYDRIAFYPDNFEVKYFQRQERTAITPTAAYGPTDVFIDPPMDMVWSDYDTTLPVLTIKGKDYTNVKIWKADYRDKTAPLPQKLPGGARFGAYTKYHWAKGYGLALLESDIYDYNLQKRVISRWELVDSYLIH